MLMYLLHAKPFEKKLTNNMEIMNELAFLISAYHLFIITDFNPNANTQYMAGWSLVSTIAIAIVVNLIVMLKITICDLIE